jgi:hypothetical protein
MSEMNDGAAERVRERAEHVAGSGQRPRRCTSRRGVSAGAGGDCAAAGAASASNSNAIVAAAQVRESSVDAIERIIRAAPLVVTILKRSKLDLTIPEARAPLGVAFVGGATFDDGPRLAWAARVTLQTVPDALSSGRSLQAHRRREALAVRTAKLFAVSHGLPTIVAAAVVPAAPKRKKDSHTDGPPHGVTLTVRSPSGEHARCRSRSAKGSLGDTHEAVCICSLAESCTTFLRCSNRLHTEESRSF